MNNVQTADVGLTKRSRRGKRGNKNQGTHRCL